MPRRVFKSSPDSMAGLVIEEQFAQLNGSNENFFYADESGCYIRGHMSINTDPDQIRIGSNFTFPAAYKAMLPSTAVNPTPMLEVNPPIEGFTSFANEVANLLGQLM